MNKEQHFSLSERVGLVPNPYVKLRPELDFRAGFDLPLPAAENEFTAILAGHISRDGSGMTIRLAPGTGRGGSLDSFVFRWIGRNPVNFSNLYFKGIGIADPESALPAYSVTPLLRETLAFIWGKEGIPVYTYQPGEDEAIGVATLPDAALDATKSLEMHRAGLRVRLPVVTYELLALPVDGRYVTVPDLIRDGWPFDPENDSVPAVSLWARRYPYTFRDLERVLNKAKGKDRDRLNREILFGLARSMLYESEPAGRRLGLRLVRELPEAGLGACQKMKFQVMGRIAAGYGRQIARMKRLGMTHGMLTDHNISPAIEFTDNSTVSFRDAWKEREKDLKTAQAHEARSILWHIHQLNGRMDEGWGLPYSQQKSQNRQLDRIFVREYVIGLNIS